MPGEAINRLSALSHVEVIPHLEPGDWRSMFWRFEDTADPHFEVVLCRDADSRLNLREKSAVVAWLETGSRFHVMRDHPHHNAPMLGGMWGARVPAMANLNSLIAQWEPQDRWGTDQDFLTTVLAPVASKDWTEHDPYFAKKRFPTRRRGREFVGQPFDVSDRPLIMGPTEIEATLRRWLGPFLKRWKRA